ncbi:MAG: formate C-acetyltransferase [Spirochaetaceae bacterium]|jgi:formate C-acetyltransferase|nr:formate C-acetyltransferase [Spirochaetaceae bacterium]
MENRKEWDGFSGKIWKEEINVCDFIQQNYTPYEGDASFLADPTRATQTLMEMVADLSRQEQKAGGVLDLDTKIVSTITSHKPGYLNKDLEKIVGIQTDKPFKRGMFPYGGVRMVEEIAKAYGYTVDPAISLAFRDYRKTHNQGVFDAYTEEMRAARRSGIITGLPDAYGRGRIIGDYRRVALYGVDALITGKEASVTRQSGGEMSDKVIRQLEELHEQLRALHELKELGAMHGFDLSRPAATAQEAFQWLYFGYLAAVKEQNGAAMSLGRTSTFLDIYIERDFANKTITESEAQELVDHFVMKLRLVKFARTPEYNALFSGDPTWVTESIGGMGVDGRPLVTKNSFRFLRTLDNLGAAPEPNLTVLWSERLPRAFKQYCAEMSIKTSAVQYENDDVMRPHWGDDYGIACCVSAMRIGKQMQFFGARANIAKALLYAINGGVDEVSKVQVAPKFQPVVSEYLEYDEVMDKFKTMLDWFSSLYVNTLNIIHYMHDKYFYERIQMALHDTDVMRTMATGISGFSIAVDSLSAIKYAKVKTVRDENGIVVDYIVEGDYPKYGNNDERVDAIAVNLLKLFMSKVKRTKTYRNGKHTTSILTITSNVVYGKKTGATPDGRRAGTPFAPGANPMHGRDTHGALASLTSVAKLPYSYSLDGISNTFSIVPAALGRDDQTREQNLVALLDGYVKNGGHHLNVNVFKRETLLDAQTHPEKYPQLTIRVSGYAVRFTTLTKEQQDEVILRTIHDQVAA